MKAPIWRRALDRLRCWRKVADTHGRRVSGGARHVEPFVDVSIVRPRQARSAGPAREAVEDDRRIENSSATRTTDGGGLNSSVRLSAISTYAGSSSFAGPTDADGRRVNCPHTSAAAFTTHRRRAPPPEVTGNSIPCGSASSRLEAFGAMAVVADVASPNA